MKGMQFFEKSRVTVRKALLCVGVMTILGPGCTRSAGEGGHATILGRVEVEQRVVITNPNGAVLAPAADHEVFITYGDRVGPDDRIHTNYDGEFAFYGLRTGNYTVFVYSEDTMPLFNNAPKVAVVREIIVESRDEEVDLGVIRIYEDI